MGCACDEYIAAASLGRAELAEVGSTFLSFAKLDNILEYRLKKNLQKIVSTQSLMKCFHNLFNNFTSSEYREVNVIAPTKH